MGLCGNCIFSSSGSSSSSSSSGSSSSSSSSSFTISTYNNINLQITYSNLLKVHVV